MRRGIGRICDASLNCIDMPDNPTRVLVIDDDKALAEAIGESLTRKGHAVTVATSGKAGAAKVETDEFDVVLTDLKMADLDGLEVVSPGARRTCPMRRLSSLPATAT